MDNKTKEFIKENAVSEGFLQDWYQNSVLETDTPVWTDEHIAEMVGDFYMIPKSDLTKFAKDCVYAHEKAVKLECISEDIIRNQIGKELINDNQNILLEVSKRFAKYARENMNVDLDNGEVQNLQNILNAIINCCEENNWFE